MKKILIAVLGIMLIASCTGSKTDFVGVKDLKLGADFNKVPFSKLFSKVKNDEYNLPDYSLPFQIGSISDFTIKTDDDERISMIRFTTNEKTDVAALNSTLKNYMVNPIDIDIADPESIKVYQTTKNTALVIFETVSPTNQNQIDLNYMYVHQKGPVANGKKLMESNIR